MDGKNSVAYINGNIFTSDDSNLYAEAMLVENGIITWVGRDADMPKTADQTIDLMGKRVIPSFVDAHEHPLMLANFIKQISALPPAVNSIEELIEEVKKFRKMQGKGQWIQGWGYDEGKFAEQRSPNRYDLDKGCSDSPVFIMRACAHICAVNSKALEIAGITRDTPDPAGGEIERDETGEPTGVLKENARNLIATIIPPVTFEQYTDNIKDLGDTYLSQGITAVTDMGIAEKRDPMEYYNGAAAKGFRQRVSVYYFWDFYENDPGFTITPEKMNSEKQIRAAGIKILGDGSFSGHTAWTDKPYLGTDYCGINTCSDELVDSAIEFCKKHHCQLSMHAMGSRAIDRIVDRAAKEKKWTDGSIPHLRLEHVTEPTERAVRTTVEKGYAYATQPIFLYAEIESYLANLGHERTKTTYPLKDWLDKGVNFCLSTDAPATSWATPSDPFPNIKAAVTRYAYDGTDCGQVQKIDIETAIKLYTRYSAKVCGFEKIGCLKEGFYADFIVLSDDILSIEADDIDKVKVDETYIAGKCVYERS